MIAYRCALSEPTFRRFWVGYAISTLGDGLTAVALVWSVYERTRSAEAVGLFVFVSTAPVLVGGLLAGWLLERFGPRDVVIADSIVRGIAVGAVPVLAATGQLQLGHLFLVGAIYGFFKMIPLAGGPTLVAAIVPAASRSAANALESLGFTVTGLVAPALFSHCARMSPAPTTLPRSSNTVCPAMNANPPAGTMLRTGAMGKDPVDRSWWCGFAACRPAPSPVEAHDWRDHIAMSFIFAAVGVTLILLVFGAWDARRIGRSHAECASRDVSLMASMRLLVWAIALSVAGLVLVPAAHAPEVRVVFVGADLILGVALLLLRRQAQRSTHELRA